MWFWTRWFFLLPITAIVFWIVVNILGLTILGSDRGRYIIYAHVAGFFGLFTIVTVSTVVAPALKKPVSVIALVLGAAMFWFWMEPLDVMTSVGGVSKPNFPQYITALVGGLLGVYVCRVALFTGQIDA